MDAPNNESLSAPKDATKAPVAHLMEVAATCVVFSYHHGQLRVLAIREESAKNALWHLPNYAFNAGMALADAAMLSVRKMSRMPLSELFQIGAVTTPNAGGIEVGFLSATWIPNGDLGLTEDPAAQHLEACWLSLEETDKLTKTAAELVTAGLTELKRRSRFDRIAFALLPPEFSLSELQRVFEVIIGKPIDVRNFRKKMESLQILSESAHRPRGMAHRPPKLYSFSEPLFHERLEKDPEVRFF